jgi:prevent-host-death family protein
MDVSVADAKKHLSELQRSVDAGEDVLITRNGKPVARLVPAPRTRRVVRFGTMRGRIHLKPGWDTSIDLDQFFTGQF